MFGLTSPHGRDCADPLQERKTAAEWFRDLPALDVIGRQEHVIAAFARLRQTRPLFDHDRVAALLFLDATLAVDQRRLLKWHFENLRGSAKLADRFWDAAHDVGHGFIFAYDAALTAALAHADDRRWKACLPRLTARLIHYHGVDAMLRLFHGGRVIPAGWRELHALFLRACELRYERLSPVLPGEDPLATHATVEHEYVHLLLLDQLHTGNLMPVELDWASARLHAWSRNLMLDTLPRTADGFCVDLAGAAGLARHDGKAEGAKVAYLDTTKLVIEIERALAALRERDPDGEPRPDLVTRQRIAILEKIRPAVAPGRHADWRRHPRAHVDLAVDIRVGLSQIARDLASPGGALGAHAAAHPPAPGPDPTPLRWRVSDRSAAGWRISAPGGVGQSLALGALVALCCADDGEWVLGVVSRLAKGAREEIVAGMSLIANRIVPVALHGRRRAQAEMSFLVDGIDVSTIGARFDGLYLMPPSRLDARLAARTLIIPASEHFDGRNVVLTTAHSNYVVKLGHVIDQRADWSWVTIRVAGKTSK